MKRLVDQSLYEILEVPPDASTMEIERAYARALELYGPGSLATYSLVGPEETALLKDRIEEAKRVLLDPDARARYDARLAAEALAAEAAVRIASTGSGAVAAGPQRPWIVPSSSTPPPRSDLPPAGPGRGRAEAKEPAPEEGAGTLAPDGPEGRVGVATSEAPPAAAEGDEARAGAPQPAPAVQGAESIHPAEAAQSAGAVQAAEAVQQAAEATRPAEAAPPAEVAAQPTVAVQEVRAEPSVAEAAALPAPDAAPHVEATPAPPEASPEASQALPAAEPTAAAADASPPPPPGPAAPAPIQLKREVQPELREFPVPDGAVWSGEALRRVRESRGLSVREVCERTKITPYHLENIEAERYSLLPAPVYLRGILVAVARELRLDGQKVARSFLERAAAGAPRR